MQAACVCPDLISGPYITHIGLYMNQDSHLLQVHRNWFSKQMGNYRHTISIEVRGLTPCGGCGLLGRGLRSVVFRVARIGPDARFRIDARIVTAVMSPALLRTKAIVIGFLLWHSDDVIKWKHFSRYWPFVRGIHRSPVNSPHKGQWRGALMFSLICAWTNGWANNREAGD